MTDPIAGDSPLIELTNVVKHYAGLRPLRIARLAAGPRDRLALSGFDAGAAEMLMHLITGAAVADEGEVRVLGRDTRAIATDTEWLASLDRFGIVTNRAVLLDTLSIASNLALPLSLSIDPMPPEVAARVRTLAGEVGLSERRLEDKAGTLDAEERVRVHLARALAPGPTLMLLEHPTAAVNQVEASSRLGDLLRRVTEARDVGWIAVTEDAAFARAAGARRLRLMPATGALSGEGMFGRWFGRR